MSQQKNKCIDPVIGNLIMLYELDSLSSKNREKFEDHLIDCKFCRSQVEEMSEMASFLRTHKTALREVLALHEQPSTVSQKAGLFKLMGDFISGTIVSIGESISWLTTTPQRYAPVLAVATIVFTILILPDSLFKKNPYLPYLSFEPLTYREMVLRSDSDASEKLFRKAMSYYNQARYDETITSLEKITEQSPEVVKYWLYLGVSYYLNKQPKRAIDALEHADNMSIYTLKPEIYWYLMQAYLLNRDFDDANRMHKKLVAINGNYGLKADSLWNLIAKDNTL